VRSLGITAQWYVRKSSRSQEERPAPLKRSCAAAGPKLPLTEHRSLQKDTMKPIEEYTRPYKPSHGTHLMGGVARCACHECVQTRPIEYYTRPFVKREPEPSEEAVRAAYEAWTRPNAESTYQKVTAALRAAYAVDGAKSSPSRVTWISEPLDV
jgi:hypothetical protein